MMRTRTLAETSRPAGGTTRLVLSNERLRVVVLPELGGRVWEITHLASGRQLLWHAPGARPTRVPFGADYDDNFAGGWDELYPNDLPERLAGRDYPDHGEAWAAAWDWEVLPGEDAAVRLWLHGPVSGSRLVRTLRLAPGSSALEVAVEVSNGTGAALPFMHKQHLAADLPPGSRIDLPRARVEIGDFGRPRAGSPGDRFAWPVLETDEGPVDFAPEPPGAASELLFASGLDAGWVACTQPDGIGIGLVFDPSDYPACWTFTSWGGWRGLRVAVLEPCTGTGLSVRDGAQRGTHRVLGSDEVMRTGLSCVVYEGLARVTGISGRGSACTVSGVPR